jgi:DnaJ like chaperone protein
MVLKGGNEVLDGLGAKPCYHTRREKGAHLAVRREAGSSSTRTAAADMQWTGKILGGAIGAFFGPIGIAVGAILGHQYDHQMAAGNSGAAVGQQFFRTTFEIMGHVAKADGRVSEREIAAARAIMASLRLNQAQVHEAIGYFTAGKRDTFDLDAALSGLRRAVGAHPHLLRVFLEIQLRAAMDGNDLQDAARARLTLVAQRLGVNAVQMRLLEAALRQHGGRARPPTPESAEQRLQAAYRTLEIEPAASNAQVVKAYRRLMSRHHPDKLKANGLPESMLEHAKQRTQQVREAYEILREQRGIT